MKNLLFFLVLSTQLICFNGFSQSKSSHLSDANKKSFQQNYNILYSNNSITGINQVYTNAAVNSVTLTQIGLNNVADINQSMQTQQNINQLGNQNYYTFIDYYNSSPINFSVLQQGNANSLQIYGSNSIINGMKITQKSNFKNIIIKNYK